MSVLREDSKVSDKKSRLHGMHSYVPISLHRDVKLAAALRGESMSSLVCRALAKEVRESLREERDV